MDRGLPHRSRQARAIAISASLDSRRKAMLTRIALVLASAAVLLQAMTMIHSYMTAHS